MSLLTLIEGFFRCLSSPLSHLPEIEGLTKSRWDVVTPMINDCQTSIDVTITCLKPGARLRYVKKDQFTGEMDSSETWNLEEGIEFAGLMFLAWDQSTSIGVEKGDGSFEIDYSSECGCNQVCILTF